MESNIQVAVRIRPKTLREEFKNDAIEINENSIKVIDSDRFFENTYCRIFPPLSSQDDVYSFVGPSIEKVEEGIGSTVMVYGQTGSGKTHTMFGREDDPGIILRAVSHLLRLVGDSYIVSFSMVEIYLEKIYDNLQESAKENFLRVREDKLFGVYLPGLTEYIIQNYSEVSELINRGISNRVVRSTEMSDCSSRSHCICQFVLESKTVNKSGNISRSKINLIDLAGSERLSKTGAASPAQLKELVAINKSLTTLSNIISILSSKNSKHVPYRDSKLTYLLKDSLLGKTGISMIATVSPTVDTIDETICTLRVASRAKLISIDAKAVEISVADNKLVQRLQREIRYLKDIIKVPRGSEDLHQKIFSLQEENEKLKEGLGSNLEIILEENRIMKEKLKQLAKAKPENEPDELDKFCDKYKVSNFTSTTSSFRQTTPNAGGTLENRLIEVRIRKNPNFAETRTASLHKTLEQFDREQSESVKIEQQALRQKTLKQIQDYRETKAKEALEKYENVRSTQNELVRKLEEFRGQPFSEVNIKQLREIDQAKKETAKAEAERDRAFSDLTRIKSRQEKLAPLRYAGTQQVFCNKK